MSFSDLILAILVLCGAASIIWILDINPYSHQLKLYTQTCDNMILENTYCKGNWLDNPVEIFTITQETEQVTSKQENQADSIVHNNCTIQDRKNWSCTDEITQHNIVISNGLIVYDKNNDIRQITRLEWLQNKLLDIVN